MIQKTGSNSKPELTQCFEPIIINQILEQTFPFINTLLRIKYFNINYKTIVRAVMLHAVAIMLRIIYLIILPPPLQIHNV